MIISAISRPTASPRVNPKVRSAAGLNSTIRPRWSIVMIASRADSRTAPLRASLRLSASSDRVRSATSRRTRAYAAAIIPRATAEATPRVIRVRQTLARVAAVRFPSRAFSSAFMASARPITSSMSVGPSPATIPARAASNPRSRLSSAFALRIAIRRSISGRSALTRACCRGLSAVSRCRSSRSRPSRPEVRSISSTGSPCPETRYDRWTTSAWRTDETIDSISPSTSRVWITHCALPTIPRTFATEITALTARIASARAKTSESFRSLDRLMNPPRYERMADG